jgi:hypothetical protein
MYDPQPLVLVDAVTVVGLVTAPATGENVGAEAVGVVIVYAADPTLESE